MMKISVALSSRKASEVLALVRTLPQPLQSDRSVLLMRMEAAESLSLQERALAMSDWRKVFPDPMDLPLKTSDYLTAEGRFEEARTVLQRFDAKLGGDMMLKLRAGELRILQKRANALAAKQNAPADAGAPVVIETPGR